ncbi:MAG: O-antigen ligase family protein [Gemmataceae bacterium]
MPGVPFMQQVPPGVRPAAPPHRPQLPPMPPANGLGFALFILVNLALFIRPADIIPALQGMEIYQYLILSCLAISFPAVLARLAPEQLERSPIDVCVLLLLPIIVISHGIHSQFADAWEEGFRFFKIQIYYFLLVSLVTTPGRLRTFTSFLVLFSAVTTLISILDHVKVIQLPRPAVEPGSRIFVDPDRMYGPGIFSDPNDICVLIAANLLLLLGRMTDKQAGALRIFWLVPLAIFGVGFYLTQSRGGLIAVMGGLGVMAVLRWGWNRAIMLGALGLPLLLVLLAGRMTAISTHTNTGQERIELWNAGLVMFKENPLFGVGQDRYHLEAGHVAHNSFMQQFADTGFFGGLLYLGAVLLAVWGLARHTAAAPGRRQMVPRVIIDPGYRQMHPFLAGAMTAYAGGMLTLTMNLLVTTYAFLGLASVFLERAETTPPPDRQKWDGNLVLRLVLLSMTFLIGMFLFVRVTYRP